MQISATYLFYFDDDDRCRSYRNIAMQYSISQYAFATAVLYCVSLYLSIYVSTYLGACLALKYCAAWLLWLWLLPSLRFIAHFALWSQLSGHKNKSKKKKRNLFNGQGRLQSNRNPPSSPTNTIALINEWYSNVNIININISTTNRNKI